MIRTVVRFLLILAALFVLLITPLYAQSSDGTTSLLLAGAVIDAVAILVLVGSVWSLLRDRRR